LDLASSEGGVAVIRFAFPNVSYSGHDFIGCGRYTVHSGCASPGPEYRYVDALPNASNISAILKAARILAGAPYNPERLIFEIEDEHDPEEDYQGDSCSLAYLLALIHRSLPFQDGVAADWDLWCTGNVRFDDRPRIEAVYPAPFELKLQGFIDSSSTDRIFIVPAANILQHHEALCRINDIRILELMECEGWHLRDLLSKKTLLKLDLDELSVLVDVLFAKSSQIPSAKITEPESTALPSLDSIEGRSDERQTGRSEQETGQGDPIRVSQSVLPGTTSRLRILVAIGIFISVLAGLMVATWRGAPPSQSDATGLSFRLMHMGQLAQAEAAVQTVSPKDPRYFEGWSALHLSRGEIDKARDSYHHLLDAAPGRPYSAVLNGHLALLDGKLEQSESAYNNILERSDLEPWQRAECHFGLGRIQLQRNAPDQAAQQFDKVIQLDPAFVQAYTGKGLALERLGELPQAVEYYDRAVKTNPDDYISASLAQRSREKLQAQAQEERRARIDALVEDLAKAYRENPAPTGGDEDDWSSKPLYLFFTDLDVQGQPAVREGENSFLSDQITRQVGQGSRIHLVERAILDKLLAELKLAGSQITDRETALRLGKVLSARIIVAGSIVRYSGEIQITLRAVDTETTLVTVIATDACVVSENPKEMLRRLALGFQEQVMAAYPIRARISAVRDGEIALNVGSLVGVKPGMKLHLVEPTNQSLDLIVKEVHQKFCTAVPQADAASLQVGWRVEGT
jgi:tetratricopeptide (TPR) repeat protein